MTCLAHLVALLLGCLQAPAGQSLILGRLVDEAGEPIADAEVTIDSAGRWRADAEAPLVRARDGREFHGFIGSTDAQGRFELRVPITDNDFISVRLAPGEFQLLVDAHFGMARKRPPLAPGRNDLGTLVSRPAGVLVGRIVSPDGEPVSHARIRPRPGVVEAIPITWSAADGTFRLAHLPAKAPLLIRATGHRDRDHVPSPVEAGRVAQGFEAVLHPATRLTGRVTTGDGDPIQGVAIRTVRPMSHAGSGRTDAAGQFEIWFDHDQAETIVFDAPGYEVTRAPYEPGDPVVNAVLTPAPTAAFEVVDRRTGKPIETFGIRLSDLEWTDHEPIAHVHHPGGRVQLPLRPDRLRWQIEAPGHGPQEGRVDMARAREGPFRVQLEQASQVRGVVTDGADPVPFATVRLALDVTLDEPEYDVDTAWYFVEEEWADLSLFVGRMRQIRADASGHFEFDDLAGGTYRLTVAYDDGRFVDLRQLRVPPAAALDLGGLVPTHGARVHGRVTVGGEPAADILVSLARSYADAVACTRTDATGAYEFQAVHSAWYQIRFAGQGWRKNLYCNVPSDETLRLDIDL